MLVKIVSIARKSAVRISNQAYTNSSKLQVSGDITLQTLFSIVFLLFVSEATPSTES